MSRRARSVIRLHSERRNIDLRRQSMTASRNHPVTQDVQSTDDVVMRVRDASVTFDMDRGESRVLNGVSMDIHRQEILGIVGESGSGKSMFASALLDAVVEPGQLEGEVIYHPEQGEPVNVLQLEQDELRRLRWEEIAMVFQGAMSSFNPTMKIRGHFEETLKTHDYDIGQGMARARELLTDLYLEPERVLDSYPHELSGGMSQRALIALSLVLDPNVLVMDEPTAALDLLMQRSILNLLQDLQEKYGLTVVFITHDLPLVAGLADRLAVLYAFEFVEHGPAEEIISNPWHPYTRALLKAVPNLDAPLNEMQAIGGSAPDPVKVPEGCSYHTRCPLATDQCRAEDPGLETIDDDHLAACFHWDQAADEIPLTFKGEHASRIYSTGKQSAESIVTLDDVTVHFEESTDGLLSYFKSPEVVHAVDDVTLDIYENDVVALVGESGCGKTTLGKTMVGAQRPSEGSIKYRGQDIWDAKEFRGEIEIPFSNIRRALQIIHQDPGSSLNPNRKVLGTLGIPLQRWHPEMSTQDRRSRVLTLLEHVGMTPPDDYASRYPHQLSGGEKQRVALIRALLMNPDVILADEAVSALDVSLRVEMMDLMLELQDLFNTSYFFVSHNLSNARYFAGKAEGRIGVMYLGKIVEIGPAEEIINNPQHPYTKILKWSTADLMSEEETGDPPVRKIDIPDPVGPPSGCRFHTRCPVAREHCTHETPTIDSHDGAETAHTTACFRTRDENHPYWESDPLEGAREQTIDEESIADD